jgi:hypothetical protein
MSRWTGFTLGASLLCPVIARMGAGP